MLIIITVLPTITTIAASATTVSAIKTVTIIISVANCEQFIF